MGCAHHGDGGQDGPGTRDEAARVPGRGRSPMTSPWGLCPGRLTKGRSSRCPSWGINKPAPTRIKIANPASRRASSGRPSVLSRAVPARVATLKLTTSPATTATERRCRALVWPGSGVVWPGSTSAVPATSTTGRTGRMQGEIPAMKPATRPISRSPTTALLKHASWSHGARAGCVRRDADRGEIACLDRL